MEEVTVTGAPPVLLGVSSGTTREIGIVPDNVRVGSHHGRDGGVRLDRLLDRRVVRCDGRMRGTALRVDVSGGCACDVWGGGLDAGMRRDERGDGRV